MPRDVPEPIPSKFVIRKLPPELTEDAFKAILDNVCQDELEWFRYHSGSSGCGVRAAISPYRHIMHILDACCRQETWHTPSLRMLSPSLLNYVNEMHVPVDVNLENQKFALASPRNDRDTLAFCRESGITTSTAFIKLRNPGLAPILKQLLQNSPFIGDHGVPYHCEMEVAFYQRVPKERTKEDPSVATYEQGVLHTKL